MVRTLPIAIFLTFLIVCFDRRGKGYSHPSTEVSGAAGQRNIAMATYNHTTTLAERWATRWRQTDDVKHKLLHYNHHAIGGITNFKVGPPEYLEATARGKWKANLIQTLRECIRDYLLPHQESLLQKSWEDLKGSITDSITTNSQTQTHIDTNKCISRGINKVYKCQITHNPQQQRLPIPPPPAETLDIAEDTLTDNTTEEAHIDTLRRGEAYTPLNIKYHTQKEGGYTTDIAKILGWAIYGHRHRESFIYRNIVKYIDTYIDREKKTFTQTHTQLRKGGTITIKHIKQLRNLIRDRKSLLGTYELHIVALLYQTQIRIFRRGEESNNSSNVECIHQTTQAYTRVINILQDTGGHWTLLTARTTHTYTNLDNSKRRHKANPKQETSENDRGSKEEINTNITHYSQIEQLAPHNAQPDIQQHIRHQLTTIENNNVEKNDITTKTRNTTETTRTTKEQRQTCTPDTSHITGGGTIQTRIAKDTDSEESSMGQVNNANTHTLSPSRKQKHTTYSKPTETQGHQKTAHTLDIHEAIQRTGIQTDTPDKDTMQVEKESDVDSESTTSSIAALFIDKHLETHQSSGKRSKKQITRRAVWNRWRNMIRGKHKREQRNKQRIESQKNKERESRKLVFDYTTSQLSEGEMSLLGKGETFSVVNYKVDEDRSKVDIYTYQRRLRLHECFRDPMIPDQEPSQRQKPTRRTETSTPTRPIQNVTNSNTPIGRRNSGSNIHTPIRVRNSIASIRRNTQTNTHTTQASTPIVNTNTHTHCNYAKNRRLPSTYDPESKNRNLHRYNTCIQEEIMLTLQNKAIPFRDNISRTERIAMKTLTDKIHTKQIIITKADKGSGLVAVDYDTYINKGTKYIEQEAQAYEKIEDDEQTIITKIVKTRNRLVEQLTEHQIIPPHTALYIKKQLEEKITGIKFFYKIHKDTNIQTMPLRPLQSCIKAPTHHLSIVLTDILQPLLTTENIPTFIFDSNQLLYRLHQLGSIPTNCTLISSDVAALYPSIPHQEGFVAMNSFLKDNTKLTDTQIISILKALELVITENYTTWNKRIYKQTRGVAMGTPVAVAYANIFMHWVDRQIKLRAPYIHEHIRYIDDNIFILPTHNIEDLMHTANNILPPHIKFTYEKLDTHTSKGLPFLDTQLTIAQDYTIQSRLYTKTTDRHAYLLPTSYHPPHITHNIPTAVLGRVKKLCSTEEWYREDAQKAVGWLLDRGYKKKDIDVAVQKTDNKDRWQMIEQIELNRTKVLEEKKEGIYQIPLIMTYNQHNRNIKKVLKLRQPLLNNAFSKTQVRPRLSYRRQKNLNDTLIQKGLRGPIDKEEKGTNVYTKCRETPSYRTKCPCKGTHRQDKCRCCMHSKTTVDNIQTKLHKPANCNSKNIIYIIGCNRCEKKYVGETQQRLKDRLAQHMYNMDKLNQPLYLHFRYTHKLDNLYITIVETVKSTEPFFRKVREAWWINHLHTLEPQGLNVKLDCCQIYTGENSQGERDR